MHPSDKWAHLSPDLPQDLDAYLAAAESRWDDLRSGAEKKIVWHVGQPGLRRPLSLVYLHGFSASRREIAPVCDRVADALEANLFYTRLAGHGRSGEAMAQVEVRDWQADVVEALAIGHRLGRRTVLVGTSTGGTLAVWAATRAHRSAQPAAVVLLSPNFQPRNPASLLALWPPGLRLIRRLFGSGRAIPAENSAHAACWTLEYPWEAITPMMRLVRQVAAIPPADFKAPLLVFYHPLDRVVSPRRIRRFVRDAGSRKKEIIALDPVGDTYRHVIAGDIFSPVSNDRVVSATLAFLRSVNVVDGAAGAAATQPIGDRP